MTNQEIKIHFKQYNRLAELELDDQELCKFAADALQNSHSPYSNFRVGAALRLESGKVVLGSNQENVAYPSGLCAERVALFTFGANYPEDKIQSIAITAQTDDFNIMKPITPCGSCLQVMAEYEKKQGSEVDVLLYCIDGAIWKIKGINSFLPFLFFEDRLGKG